MIIGGGVLLLGAVAVLVWSLTDEEEPQRFGRESAGADVAFPEVDPYEFFREEGDGDEVATAEPSAMGMRGRGMEFSRADWERLTPEERRAKRLEMREEWQRMTPAERAERRARRAARRVQVSALGDEEPALEAVDVMNTVREVRPQIRDCVEQNGGWQQFREQMAASANPDGGGGGRGMNLAFDVMANGQVGDLAMNPPPPEGFSDCFTNAFSGLEMPAPGADAHVEIQFGGARGRARARNNGRQGG